MAKLRTEVRELRSKSSSSSLPGSRTVVGLMSKSRASDASHGGLTVSQCLFALFQVTSSGEDVSTRRLHSTSGLYANARGAAGDDDDFTGKFALETLILYDLQGGRTSITSTLGILVDGSVASEFRGVVFGHGCSKWSDAWWKYGEACVYTWRRHPAPRSLGKCKRQALDFTVMFVHADWCTPAWGVVPPTLYVRR